MSTYTLNLTLSNIRMITIMFLDIFVVWFLLYYVLRIVRGNTRTVQIFKGILLVVLIDGLAKILGLKTLQFFADMFINWGFLAIIIIFQPEIRTLLEHIGKSNVFSRITTLTGNEKENLVEEIVTAVMLLSKDQTGALISIEQSRSLDDYIETGTKLKADVTAELLTSIFVTSTPLHDGAVIIQGDKIACASAYFPPTTEDLPSRYGARHRAAIGISEITDAVTIVVSEETGNVSISEAGNLMLVDREQLRNYLLRVICGESTEVHAKRPNKDIYVSEKSSRAEQPVKKGSMMSKLAIRRREEPEVLQPEPQKQTSSKVAVEEVIPARRKAKTKSETKREERVHKEADEEAQASMIKLPHKKKRPKPSYPERSEQPAVKTPDEVPAETKPIVPEVPAPVHVEPVQVIPSAVMPADPEDELPEIAQEPVPAESAVQMPQPVMPAEPAEELNLIPATDDGEIQDEIAAPRTRFEEVRASREAAYRILYGQQAAQKAAMKEKKQETAKKAAREGSYDTTQLDISKIVGFNDELDSTFQMVDNLPSDKSSDRKGGNK